MKLPLRNLVKQNTRNGCHGAAYLHSRNLSKRSFLREIFLNSSCLSGILEQRTCEFVNMQLSTFSFSRSFPFRQVERLFKMMDVTKKGVVEYNEFLAAAIAAKRKMDEPSLRAAFAMLDVDDDGIVTKADLMRTIGRWTEGGGT